MSECDLGGEGEEEQGDRLMTMHVHSTFPTHWVLSAPWVMEQNPTF